MSSFDSRDVVVAFDMDGTLLDADNNVIGGEETVDILGRLQRRGCTMAIGTGRLDHDIIRAGERFGLHFDNRISQHGAVRRSKGRVEAELLNPEDALEIFNRIEDAPVRIEVNTVSNRYWTSERDPDFPKELYDSHIIKGDLREVIRCQPIVLFLLVGDGVDLEPIARMVGEEYPGVQAVMSSKTSLEVMPRGVSKGSALAQMYAGKRIMAIGDAPNDFEMFGKAERSYLVSDLPCPVDVVREPSILEALKDIEGLLA